VKKLPDGRIAAKASYRGGSIAIVLPPQMNRYVSVGATYDVGAAYDVGQEAIIGNIWNSLAKGLAKLHHSKIVQNVAAGTLALYGVPPGVTKRGMQLTGDLLDKARAGNPQARARVQQIGRGARAGQPAPATAAAAILHRNRADRRARAAMDLLNRAQLGNPRAQAAIQRIEQRAAAGDRTARTAQTAMQAVLAASAGRQPAPPVVRASRRVAPPPPARAAARGQVLSLANARVLRTRQLPGGRKELLVQVGGAGMDWLKRQLGYTGPYRAEGQVEGLRDLYLMGTR
jgi:hypothetical protein